MVGMLRSPATYIWLLLMMVTGGSLWIAVDHGIDDTTVATAVVMTLAVVKAYLVGMFFMELRHAPFVLRAVFNAWCTACWAAVLGIYLLG